MEIDIANIISAAGTLLAAYFAYNQYTKNKLTDLKEIGRASCRERV